MVVAVEKIGIGSLLFWFILYIVFHAGFGYLKNITDKNYEKKPFDNDLEKQKKLFDFLFKWFSTIYLILIIIMFYLQ